MVRIVVVLVEFVPPTTLHVLKRRMRRDKRGAILGPQGCRRVPAANGEFRVNGHGLLIDRPATIPESRHVAGMKTADSLDHSFTAPVIAET